MDRIGSYGVYQNNYYDNAKSAKADTRSASLAKESGNTTQKKVEFSDNAKKLLKELQKSYGNTDFIVADYETDEEAQAYLSRGTSKYSVLLTPDELEKMASDENKKNENLKILDDAFAKLDEMKEKLGENGQEVSRLGVVLGDDGEVSFFAELEKSSQKQRERIEENRENKQEEAKKAEKEEQAKRMETERRPEPVKRTVVRADSIDELAEKISQVNWDNVPEPFTPSGHHYNFTV